MSLIDLNDRGLEVVGLCMVTLLVLLSRKCMAMGADFRFRLEAHSGDCQKVCLY